MWKIAWRLLRCRAKRLLSKRDIQHIEEWFIAFDHSRHHISSFLRMNDSWQSTKQQFHWIDRDVRYIVYSINRDNVSSIKFNAYMPCIVSKDYRKSLARLDWCHSFNTRRAKCRRVIQWQYRSFEFCCKFNIYVCSKIYTRSSICDILLDWWIVSCRGKDCRVKEFRRTERRDKTQKHDHRVQ